MNWWGDGTIASALEAQPNWKSSSGTPPTAPCSITQVTAPCRPSSIRMRGTLAEMPKPILTASPSRSSCATRRAITLATPNSGVSKDDSGPEDLARDRRLVGGVRRLHLVGRDDDVRRPGRPARRRRAACSVPARGEALDLRDDDAAIVAHRERLVERAEIAALVLVGEIAALVGGRRADDRDVGDDRLERRASRRRRSRRGLTIGSAAARRVHRAALADADRRRCPCRPWSARPAASPPPRDACRTGCRRGCCRPGSRCR